jgi:hypothetical protein
MVFTSLLGIFTLVALAWGLGFRGQARITSAEEAAREAETSLGGFDAAEAVVSDDGAAALVAARDGRMALVRSFGDRLVVRPLAGAAARLEGGTLHLRLPEPGFPLTVLALGPCAPQWAARL